MTGSTDSEKHWYAMRDLKRVNAKLPAYKELAELGFEVFTPMHTRLRTVQGKRLKELVPYVQDLVFVCSTREALDEAVAKIKTLQYRYMKGAGHCVPMEVHKTDMDSFIAAVSNYKNPQFYAPGEITPQMYGAKIKIISDTQLNGHVGTLLKIKGSRKKRLIVNIPNLLSAAVELANTDYVELIDEKE